MIINYLIYLNLNLNKRYFNLPDQTKTKYDLENTWVCPSLQIIIYQQRKMKLKQALE